MHRKQIADLILKAPDGKNLIILSPLEINHDGSMTFTTGQPVKNGEKYKVTVKIEEI